MKRFNCYFKLFRVSVVNVKMCKRGFYVKSSYEKNYLENIGISFLQGYHEALINFDNFGLINSLNQSGLNCLGFSYEGVAMAKAILDFFSIFGKQHVKKFMETSTGNRHIYMLHIGIGWGYARLPINVERRIDRFDTILRWLIIDGYGFHQAYFKTNKYVYNKIQPRSLKKKFSKHVFYQGVGRCLWFVEGTDGNRILRRIESFPIIYHSDLWSGIGLACTYAGGVEADDIKEIKRLSGSYLPHLMQGSAFAAKARERAEIIVPHVEMACSIICEMTVNDASAVCDECLDQIPENLLSEEKYEMWRALIRSKIYKTSKHEEVAEGVSN